MTSLSDTDTYILHQLPNEALYSMCNTNVYFSQLCWKDKMLRTRYIKYRHALDDATMIANTKENQGITIRNLPRFYTPFDTQLNKQSTTMTLRFAHYRPEHYGVYIQMTNPWNSGKTFNVSKKVYISLLTEALLRYDYETIDELY